MKTLTSQMRTVALQKQEAQDERIPKLTLTGSWALQGLTPTTMIPTYDYEANLQVAKQSSDLMNQTVALLKDV